MEKKSFKSTFVLILSLILTIGGILLEVIETVKYYGENWYNLNLIVNVVLFIAIAYYALRGYKTPHGNLTRYLFLILSLSCMSTGLANVRMNLVGAVPMGTQNTFMSMIGVAGVASIFVAYVGGRLNKVQGNAFVMVLVTILLIALSALLCTYYRETSGSNLWGILWNSITLIEWIYLVFAYAIRYKEHKAAGEAEKAE